MPRYDLSQLRVLLVDRHAHTRHILRGIFREFRVTNISEANSVDAAYDIFLERRPDLVVTDWEPGLDGLRLLRRIRQGEDTANPFTNVLILSANTEYRHVRQALNAGVHQYMARPFTAEGIYRRVAEMIENPLPFIQSPGFFGPDRRRREVPVPPERDRRQSDAEATVSQGSAP